MDSEVRRARRTRGLTFALAICLLAFAAVAALAANDWRKPAAAQVSVRFYNGRVIAGYYRFVRPMTARFVHCRYQPSCAAYSMSAVQTHGFPRGLWLTAKRLCRCQPWVPRGTFDPVPPAISTHG